MTIRPLLLLALAATGLSGCASSLTLPPAEVIRYHLGEPLARGTIAVEPRTANGPAALEFRAYADAVAAELARVGYAPAASNPQAAFVALVDVRRTRQEGPPKRAPFSIGIGGGSFSGNRGGGVGLGGGVGFPIGGGKPTQLVLTELSVTIKRRSDQTAIWEGQARGVSELAQADAQVGKLAGALFTGFPGQSGRTIEVK